MKRPMKPITFEEVDELRVEFFGAFGCGPADSVAAAREDHAEEIAAGVLAEADVLGIAIFSASLFVRHLPKSPVDDFAYARQQGTALWLFHDDALGEFVRTGWLPRFTPFGTFSIDICSSAFREWGRRSLGRLGEIQEYFSSFGIPVVGQFRPGLIKGIRLQNAKSRRREAITNQVLMDALSALALVKGSCRQRLHWSDREGRLVFSPHGVRDVLAKDDLFASRKNDALARAMTGNGQSAEDDDSLFDSNEIAELRDRVAVHLDIRDVAALIEERRSLPTRSTCLIAVRQNLASLLTGEVSVAEVARRTGLDESSLRKTLNVELGALQRRGRGGCPD